MVTAGQKWPVQREVRDTDELKPIVSIHDAMVEFFNLTELQTFVFDIGVFWDKLPGESLQSKVRELILHCERNEIMHRLIRQLHEDKPHLDWSTLDLQFIVLLHDAIIGFLTEEEIEALAFDLGVVWDQLPEGSLLPKVKGLIVYCEENNIMHKLIDCLQADKPHLDWSTFLH